MPQKDITKSAMRSFTYGLYVAASMAPDGPRAATISWVTQVSFEPRLIAVAMRKETAIHDAVQASGMFSLNVVGADKSDFAKAFFKANPTNDNQIAGYQFELKLNGVPVFDDAPTWIICEVVETAGDAGDHTLFVGRVVDSGVSEPIPPALALRDTPWHYGG
jgi:flavin reductase (DIM6/NTAB) family NADH-FMN oxidoreductase RutF